MWASANRNDGQTYEVPCPADVVNSRSHLKRKGVETCGIIGRSELEFVDSGDVINMKRRSRVSARP